MSEDKVAYAGQAPAHGDGYIAKVLLAELADKWCDCDATTNHKMTGPNPLVHSDSCMYVARLRFVAQTNGITMDQFSRIARGG